jgi:hypothetical protein
VEKHLNKEKSDRWKSEIEETIKEAECREQLKEVLKVDLLARDARRESILLAAAACLLITPPFFVSNSSSTTYENAYVNSHIKVTGLT